MKAGKDNRVVFVTCGTLTEGRRIARNVVRKRLSACVSVFLGPVESVYLWKGQVEQAREYLVVIKTTQKHLEELYKTIKKFHSYEVPEFIALPIVAGSDEYLAWLKDSVG